MHFISWHHFEYNNNVVTKILVPQFVLFLNKVESGVSMLIFLISQTTDLAKWLMKPLANASRSVAVLNLLYILTRALSNELNAVIPKASSFCKRSCCISGNWLSFTSGISFS